MARYIIKNGKKILVSDKVTEIVPTITERSLVDTKANATKTLTSVSTAQQRLTNAKQQLDTNVNNFVNYLNSQGQNVSSDKLQANLVSNRLINNSKSNLSGRVTLQDVVSDFNNVYNSNSKEKENLRKARNNYSNATYGYNKAKVNSESVSAYDKTIGNVTRGIADLTSNMRNNNRITDENGNVTVLPTYGELKQEKVSDSYNTGVGKFLSGVAYDAGRNIGAMALNAVTGGVGGAVVYSTDIFFDAYNQVKNEGYDKGKSFEYALVKAVEELVTGKVLGSTTKMIVGGNTSGLENIISNSINKLIQNPSMASIIGSAGSEATEEFVQEYLDNINKLFILEGSRNIDDYKNLITDKSILQDALYSAAAGALSGGFFTKVSNQEGTYAKNSTDVLTNFKNQLEETKKTLTDKTEIEKYNQTIKQIDDYISKPFGNEEKVQNILPTVEDLVKQNNSQTTQQESNNNIPTVNDLVQQEKNSTNQVSNKFQYEKSENTNIDNLRQSATKYFDNSTKTQNLVSTIEKVIEDKNYNVVFDDTIKNKNGETVNAQIITNKNGEVEIKINPNSERAGEFLLVHEITHAIETDSIKNLVVDYAKKNTEFNTALESLKKAYGVDDVSSEVVADISGQLFGNQEFINSLSMKQPSLFKKIYNKIIELANKITGNSKESLFISDLKNKWQEAYRTQSNNLNGTTYSIQTDVNGNQYVNVDTDQDIFAGKTLSEQTKIAKKYILDNFRENGINVENENINVTSRTANEYTHPKNKNSKDVASSKMKASTELDNLLNIAEYSHSDPDDGRHAIAKDGWDYYNVKFKVGNQTFEGLINIAKKGDIKTLYDITRIKKTSRVGSDNKSLTTNVTSFYDNNISQTSSDVKSDISTKYSMQENNIDTSYRSQHQPDKSGVGYDLTSEGIIDDSIYTNPEWYANMNDKSYQESYSILQKIRNNPNANVTIYRATTGNDINSGDWVTLSKTYANEHLERSLDGKGKVVEKQVKAKDIYWAGDDINEFGYFPSNNEIATKDVDNQGRTLTEEQQEFFKDSKVRDENGNLMTMYHGTPEYGFTVFDKDKSKSSGNYGSGFYFSQYDSYVADYIKGNNAGKYEVYLNIKNPVDYSDKTRKLSYDDILKLTTAISENEDYGLDNFGYGSTPKSVADSLNKHNNDYEVLLDLNLSSVGNFTELIEFANEILGTNYDGIISASETVALYPNQIKKVDNTNPTTSNDIRYSKNSKTWQKHLEDNYKATGTRTNMGEIRIPTSEDIQTRENQVNLPTTPTNESTTNVKTNTLTEQESKELNVLEQVVNAIGEESLDEKDYKTLIALRDKQSNTNQNNNNILPTYENSKVTWESIKKEYNKYKNLDDFDETLLNTAESFVPSYRNTGKRTKSEWLSVAELIGTNLDDSMTKEEITKYAIQSWQSAKPNTKETLNRQGKSFVKFSVDEWVNEIYKNANINGRNSLSSSASYNLPTPKRQTTTNQMLLPSAKNDDVIQVKNNLDNIPKDPTKESTYDEPSVEYVAKILDSKPKTPKAKETKVKTFLATKFLDKGYYVDKIARQYKNPELSAKYDYQLLSNGIGNQIIGNGRYDSKGNKTGKSLYEIFEPIENAGLVQEFSEYMYHQHNIDRMSIENKTSEEVNSTKNTTSQEDLKQEKNKPVFGESITADISKEKVKELIRKYPEFESWANDVYEYSRADLQTLVDNQVISSEDMEYYNKKYPHYVPIVRDTSKLDNGFNSYGKKATVNSPIKTANGSNLDLIPLKDALAYRTMQTTNSSLKNDFGLELYKTIYGQSNVQGESIDLDNTIDGEDILTPSTKDKSATFTIYQNGKKTTLDISDEVYEALTPRSLGTIKALNKFNNFRRGVLTEYNPTFMATNPIKDIQDGLINSKRPTKFIKNLPEAFMQIKQKGTLYQLYMANGGGQDTYFNYDKGTNIETTNKKAPTIADKINIPKKVLNVVSDLNGVIEMAPRLSEFISSIESGDSIQTAMYNSQEVTTNFKRGGDITKTLDRNGVTFLNAGVQGTLKQIRNLQESKVNGIRGIVNLGLKYTFSGLVLGSLNDLIWGDDDDYEDESDYVKNNYYIVGKYGDGNFIRIPKGRVSSVLQKFFENAIDGVQGKEMDIGGLKDLIWNNLLPNNPTENNLISPLIDAYKNETWHGGDLVPTRLQDLPSAEQYDESIDSFSIWLGEKLNISPYKVNYVLDQYSGAIGDYILPYLTLEAESGSDSFVGKLIAPIKDKFTTDSVMKNQNVSDFYSLSEELQVNSNSSQATEEDKLKYKYISSISTEMSELYAKKREIQSSTTLSDSQKYNQAREIQSQINELAKNGMETYEDVKTSSNYATVGDKEYYLNSKGSWSVIDEEESEKLNDLKMTTTQKNTYFKVKNNISTITSNESLDNSEKKTKIAKEIINNSSLTDNQISYLYSKYYSSEETLETVQNAGISLKEYIKYDSQTFESDVDENGKTIANSKKEKVINYINSLNLSVPQKALMIKMEYSSYKDYDDEIINYVQNLKLTQSEKQAILENAGFTVRNGKVYK